MKKTVVLSLLSCILGINVGHARDYYWVGGNGTWNTATQNWRLDSPTGTLSTWPVSEADAAAVFQGSGATLTVGTTVSAGSIRFAGTGWQISGGSIQVRSVTVAQDSVHTNKLLSPLTGTDVSIGGVGTLYLGNTNAYSGVTGITNVTVRIDSIPSAGKNVFGSTQEVAADNAVLELGASANFTPTWKITVGSRGLTLIETGSGQYYLTSTTLNGNGRLTLKARSGAANRFRLDARDQTQFAGTFTLDGTSLDNPERSWGSAVGPDTMVLTNTAGVLISSTLATRTIGTFDQGIVISPGSGAKTITQSGNATVASEIRAAISGSGAFTITPSKYDLILSNPLNSWANELTIANTVEKGVVSLGADEVIPEVAGRSVIVDGPFDLNARRETFGGLYSVSGTGRIMNRAVGAAELILGYGDTSGKSYAGSFVYSNGVINITKIGSGGQTFSGGFDYRGKTTLKGGELVLNRTNDTTSTFGAIEFLGGLLTARGKPTGTTAFSFGNPLFGAGQHDFGTSSLRIQSNGGSGTTVTLASDWTRQNGASLLVDTTTAGSTFATTASTLNGICNGWTFVKDAVGVGFGTVSSQNIVRYTSATELTESNYQTDLNPNVNYTVPIALDRVIGTSSEQQMYSLAVTGQDGHFRLDGKKFTVMSGGLLMTSPNWTTITTRNNGYITSGTNNLTIYNVGSGAGHGLFVSVRDNGTNKVSLIKAGPTTLIFSEPHQYSGDTIVNQSTIARLGGLPSGDGKGDLIINSSGIADISGNYTMSINGLRQTTATGGILKHEGDSGTAAFAVVGNGNANGDFNGRIYDVSGKTLTFVKVGTGTQILRGTNNTYKGGTIVSNGTLEVSSLSNIGGTNATLSLAGGKLRITGTEFTTFGSTSVSFLGGGLEIANATNTFSFTKSVPAQAVVPISGEGTLVVNGTVDGSLATENPSRITLGTGSIGTLLVRSENPATAYSPGGIGTIATNSIPSALKLTGKYSFDLATDGTSDRLEATGAVDLNGAEIILANPNVLNQLKKYTLISGASVTGSFTASNLPPKWMVVRTSTALILQYSGGTMLILR